MEVESLTEALSSPKIQEPGNSFIHQLQMHGQMQMETSNVGPEALLQDAFNKIDDITKKNLTEFCEYGLYYVSVAEKWHSGYDSTEIKDLMIIYLEKESEQGAGIAHALRFITNGLLLKHVIMLLEKPKRMKRFLSKENALLLRKDSKAFYDKKKEENEELIKEWITMLSKEQLSAFVNALKGMDATELHYNIKEALRDTRSLLKALKKLNPKRRNFDIKLVGCVLKYLLPTQDYAAVEMYIPLIVKQFRNAQNAHNPLVAAM